MIIIKELSNIEKIEWLKNNINYNAFVCLLNADFTENKLVDLYDEITENDAWSGSNFCIVDHHEGTKDTCIETSLEIWVNQTTNGGYSGDEFAGNIYVKISYNKYLMWYYNC